MWNLLLYTSNILALRDLSLGLSNFLVAEVLDFRTILKIYYRLFLVYLGIWGAAKLGLGFAKPEMEELVWGPGEVEGFASLLSALRATETSFENFGRIINVQSLWGHLRL